MKVNMTSKIKFIYWKYYKICSPIPSKLFILGTVFNNSLGTNDNKLLIFKKFLLWLNKKGNHNKINPKITTIINTIFNTKLILLYLENTCSNWLKDSLIKKE